MATHIIYLFTKKGRENIRINCYCEISSEIGSPRGLSESGYEWYQEKCYCSEEILLLINNFACDKKGFFSVYNRNMNNFFFNKNWIKLIEKSKPSKKPENPQKNHRKPPNHL